MLARQPHGPPPPQQRDRRHDATLAVIVGAQGEQTYVATTMIMDQKRVKRRRTRWWCQLGLDVDRLA